LSRPGTLSSNRGNDLLLKLLKFRFPHIVDEVTTPVLREWLSADVSERVRMLSRFEVSDESCLRELQKYTEEHTDSFPMRGLGESWIEKQKVQMALFLVSSTEVPFLCFTHCENDFDLFRPVATCWTLTVTTALRCQRPCFALRDTSDWNQIS
jgi:hypothetical protein